MSDDDTSTHPILEAHAKAFRRVGREAADAVLMKHGAPHGGPGAYRQVPESKHAACIADLEQLAAGPATNQDALQSSLKRLIPAAMANFGVERTSTPPTPRSLAELQKQAMDRFNNPPPVKRGG